MNFARLPDTGRDGRKRSSPIVRHVRQPCRKGHSFAGFVGAVTCSRRNGANQSQCSIRQRKVRIRKNSEAVGHAGVCISILGRMRDGRIISASLGADTLLPRRASPFSVTTDGPPRIEPHTRNSRTIEVSRLRLSFVIVRCSRIFRRGEATQRKEARLWEQPGFANCERR